MKEQTNLAKNTLMLSLGTFLTKGLSFIMIPFFSRWLSTEDYGVFDVICTYVTLLLPIMGLSSNEALFRFSMDEVSEENKKKYVSSCFSIFSTGVLFSGVVLMILKLTGIWNLALSFFIILIGETYNLYFRGFLRSIKRLDIYSYVNAISTVFIAIFVFLFVKVWNLKLEGMIIGYGVGYILGDIVVVFVTRFWKYFSLRCISFQEARKLINYSFSLIFNSISWWIINISDRTIILIFLGPVANGIYAIANKIPNILSSVFGTFSVSWQQSAVEALGYKDKEEYYNRIYNNLLIIILSLSCGVLSSNFILFNYIFDQKYFDAYMYSPILITGTVFLIISQFFGGIQISLKMPRENGLTTVVGAICNIMIHLLLINIIGLFAAAISTLVSQIFVCFLRSRSLKKEIHLKYSPKALLFIFFYIYFLCMAYFVNATVLSVINISIATIIVLYANKEFVFKILRKFKNGKRNG